MRLRPRNLPIFWQTLLLLLSSLVLSQAISLALIFSLPPPRPDFNRLSDVAEALAGEQRDHRGRERALIVRRQATAPAPADGMGGDPLFTRLLAERLGVSEQRTRLYFEPDQRGGMGSLRGRREGARVRDSLVPMRRGEPIFFSALVAAVDTGAGWRVVQTPPAPLLAAWQRRLLLWFALSAVLMLPLGWVFARRLTRPIRAFADAADRMSGDPGAPAVPEDGPAELQVTARALNRMQDRISTYVAERTAMIGAIAHDLRTPLARIAFRIEAAPDEVREKVQADIEQMRAMIAATIGFVKGSSAVAERVPVDLATLLGGIVEAEQEMGRPVSLEIAERPQVLADAVTLARLFQNLVDNAVAYGGRAELRLFASGGQAVVTVSDRGPGLEDEALERVFQPFERGDPSRNRSTGGIGLGLTIARSIASDYGGSLTLRKRAGGGLEARSELPQLAVAAT